MTQHRMMIDGDVEACVDCGREVWMASFMTGCPGPHPDVVAVLRDDLVRIGWREVAAVAVSVTVMVGLWAAVIGTGWAAWTLVR